MSKTLTKREKEDIETIVRVYAENPELRKAIVYLAQGLIAGAMANGCSKDND